MAFGSEAGFLTTHLKSIDLFRSVCLSSQQLSDLLLSCIPFSQEI